MNIWKPQKNTRRRLVLQLRKWNYKKLFWSNSNAVKDSTWIWHLHLDGMLQKDSEFCVPIKADMPFSRVERWFSCPFCMHSVKFRPRRPFSTKNHVSTWVYEEQFCRPLPSLLLTGKIRCSSPKCNSFVCKGCINTIEITCAHFSTCSVMPMKY